MTVRILTALLVFCIFLSESPARAASDGPRLQDSFGKREHRAMVDLIAAVDEGAAKAFRKFKGRRKALFLSRFWELHCPPFTRLYVDFHLGYRRPNASPHFYNDPAFLLPEYWVHAARPSQRDLVKATRLLRSLRSVNPSDGGVHVALGYCLLELGRLEAAEASFIDAMRIHRKEPSIYNGIGLSWVKRRNGQSVARDYFRDALALDRSYEAASYNLAMSHVATRATDVPFHIRKVTRVFPDHHDAYYKLGVWHEIRSRLDGEFLPEAMAAYEAQTAANPSHFAAWSNLARVKMQLGHYGSAAAICRRVLEEAPAYRLRVLPVLMEAYQMTGRIAEADEAASRYVSLLDADTREHFLDISLIASREEKAMLDTLEFDAREAFIEDYWLRHDPTPGTPENEKRVEHVRRVGNAMVLFSDAVQPWDTRGEVYVRYGEPRHRSRSDNMRFETDRDVVRVRERLLGALSDEERNQIRQFHRRIRTSSREVRRVDTPDGGFHVEVSDFEPAEFGADPTVGDRRFGRPDPNAREYERGHIESLNDRLPPEDIRGVPLYPVEGNRPWEYWVYPDVGPGIEVVFAAFNQHGGYAFAEPPQAGRKLSRHNQNTFVNLRPETVIARAITRQPSILRVRMAPLPFAYDAADFRGEDGRSRLEVYVGRSGGASGDSVRTDVSMILYDKSWNHLHEDTARVARAPLFAADTLSAVGLSGEVPPGQYILAVQIDDPVTGQMGATRMGIEVEAYPDGELALSDIGFASGVTTDSTTARGFRVRPYPWNTFGPTRPVVVFYEVYGLAKNAFGQTEYRVDYAVTPLEGGTLTAKVLGGIGRRLGMENRESLTISYARTGEVAEEFGFVEIDVSGSAPGLYEVVVTVTDAVTGDSVAKRKSFRVEAQDSVALREGG